MNDTTMITTNDPSSNLIKAEPVGDYYQLLREAIANGEYPTPATVEAAIDAILPIIVGDGNATRGAA